MSFTRVLSLCTVVVPIVLGPARAAGAQSSGMSVTYAPGWNMVGAPPGTDLSFASALYAYGPGGYVTPPSNVASSCTGYWGYFNTTTSASFTVVSGPPSITCPVDAGWTLLGNPFSGVAALPPGTIAYHWSPQAAAYQMVSSIPVGGAVWVYADASGSITLDYAPPPSGIVIDEPNNRGPFTVHVGQTVTLQLSNDAYTVTVDSNALQLQSSGTDPSGPYWTWLAVSPGVAHIILSPGCLKSSPPCGLPSFGVEVDIAP